MLISPKNLENILKLFLKYKRRRKTKSNKNQLNFQNLINSKIIDNINVSSQKDLISLDLIKKLGEEKKDEIIKMIGGDKEALYKTLNSKPEFKKLLNSEITNLEDKIINNAVSKSQSKTLEYLDKVEYKNKLIRLDNIKDINNEIDFLLEDPNFNKYYESKVKAYKKDLSYKLKNEPENVNVLLKNKYGVNVRSRSDKNNFETLLDTLVKKKIMYDNYGVNNILLSFRGINFNEKEYIDDIERQYHAFLKIDDKKIEVKKEEKKKAETKIEVKKELPRPYLIRSSKKK